jgi:methylenetetrahydrofolate dehydrogenase (NADP+)/methenyltetrahydrofolate cyclohydrolase
MIIDGKKIAEQILADVATRVKKLAIAGVGFRLAGVVAGDSDQSKFLNLKKAAAERVGIDFRKYEYPTNISTQKLRKEISKIAKTSVNSGIIVQLPLPSHINTQYILNAVPEEKDPDVLSQKSQGTFFSDRGDILPPAVETVKIIFEENNIKPQRKICSVFGYGILVGKPVSHWLARRGATVNIINEFTPNAGKISGAADIIISGVGKSNLITGEMVKNGAVVIDFGKDVDFENVAAKSALITPPTGGVGPIVIASLLRNLIKLKTAI